MKTLWQPTASIENLRARADILHLIRDFFAAREVLEVETPALCHHTVTDPYINSIKTIDNLHLQTSPEYAMKRLLAAGSGSIYQICKSFRQEEHGHQHNPEFTMLEWYRLDFDHHDLMREMDELLHAALSLKESRFWSYQSAFQKFLNINPHIADIHSLKNCVIQQKIPIPDHIDENDRDVWLQLLMSDCIEPQFEKDRATFIYDYPASQAALAKIRADDPPVAERFEVYVEQIELANGFHELQDASIQRERFKHDQIKRKQCGAESIEIDEYFISALEHGLPNCAGVALGIDRLVMLACKANHIEEVISFSTNNA